MKTIDTNYPPMYSPHFLFKQALILFKKQQWNDALQFIDAAIIFSHYSPFYIYQKIRFLYASSSFLNCSRFIVSQLSYLYKHSSLYIFCRTLDYLQKMNHYDVEYFCELLKHYHIPHCLAIYYPILLKQKDKPFLQLAKKALLREDYMLCLDFCELYFKLNPPTAKAYYMQAYSHHMLGQLQNAKMDYIHYLHLNPTDAKGYMSIALISMELNDYHSAIWYLKKASHLDPHNPTYLTYLAECYYITKKFHLATYLYQELLKLDPHNLQIYFNLSHIYKKMSNYKRSKHYHKLIRKNMKMLCKRRHVYDSSP